MNKQELKDGMMVKDREGRVYLVFNGNLEALTDNFEWASLQDYNDDMTCEFFAKFDIVEVRDTGKTNVSISKRFKDYESFPILWEEEEVYNFKPGDKVQVRDNEDEEWVNRYFILKEADCELKWVASGFDEFTLGCSFEDASKSGKIGVGYRYIRPYKQGE